MPGCAAAVYCAYGAPASLGRVAASLYGFGPQGLPQPSHPTTPGVRTSPARSKTSVDWFFSLKVHLVVNDKASCSAVLTRATPMTALSFQAAAAAIR